MSSTTRHKENAVVQIWASQCFLFGKDSEVRAFFVYKFQSQKVVAYIVKKKKLFRKSKQIMLDYREQISFENYFYIAILSQVMFLLLQKDTDHHSLQ